MPDNESQREIGALKERWPRLKKENAQLKDAGQRPQGWQGEAEAERRRPKKGSQNGRRLRGLLRGPLK